MKIYTLTRKQILPVSIDKAWDFFSTPRNLAKITPNDITFKILYISGGESTYPGQIIRYNITVLPLVTVSWTTEITHLKEHVYFIDEQRVGPYALWHHQHHFKPVEGGIEMTDEVNYAIPFGWLGRLAHIIFVRQKLNAIFDYRSQVIEKLFRESNLNT